jgi:hypothetical protein
MTFGSIGTINIFVTKDLLDNNIHLWYAHILHDVGNPGQVWNIHKNVAG